MKILQKQNHSKIAIFAGATALMALTPCLHAQMSGDALVDKLEQKGILSAAEARELRSENKQDFTGSFTNSFDQAFNKVTGTPGWVTGYKFVGDLRGRYDEVTSMDGNKNFISRDRYRYRLRAGLTINMKDGMEAGFRLTSGDAAPTTGGYSNGGGNPNSNNSTFQDNGTKKNIYIDTAYGKWTPLSGPGWLFSAIIGKMENPLAFTPMVFDPDWTPEGAAIQTGYTFNDQQSILVNGAAFVEDQEVGGKDTGSVRAPALFGAQVIWNANWTKQLGTSLGLGGYILANSGNLTTTNVVYNNQGNTRNVLGGLANGYTPIIADASATYKLDKFPLYPGTFPIKVAAEYINNVDASSGNKNNQGYWVGVTFGKAGVKHSWDISYRYEYLGADATYDQLADDDNGAYYQNANTTTAYLQTGYYGGTNVKGHLIKANYMITDSLTFTFSCFMNDLIKPNLNAPVGFGEPNNKALHVMADLMWKF